MLLELSVLHETKSHAEQHKETEGVFCSTGQGVKGMRASGPGLCDTARTVHTFLSGIVILILGGCSTMATVPLFPPPEDPERHNGS